MDRLVDTAVKLVEEGRLQQAVEVLQQGITLLTSTYPGRCVLVLVLVCFRRGVCAVVCCVWRCCGHTAPTREGVCLRLCVGL